MVHLHPKLPADDSQCISNYKPAKHPIAAVNGPILNKLKPCYRKNP